MDLSLKDTVLRFAALGVIYLRRRRNPRNRAKQGWVRLINHRSEIYGKFYHLVEGDLVTLNTTSIFEGQPSARIKVARFGLVHGLVDYGKVDHFSNPNDMLMTGSSQLGLSSYSLGSPNVNRAYDWLITYDMSLIA